jgi:ADP-ribosylglycohydrolase
MKAYYRRCPVQAMVAFSTDGHRLTKANLTMAAAMAPLCESVRLDFAFNTLDEVLVRAAEYTAVTHNHPEGLKGAPATTAANFLARTGRTKADIKQYTAVTFHYDLSRSVDEGRPTYRFDESCQGTVPQAIVCFLRSTSFVDAIGNAISLGADSDTNCPRRTRACQLPSSTELCRYSTKMLEA